MRDFSYKMQQMSDFSCKNQGREPGRPKKNTHKKKQKNAHPLISVLTSPFKGKKTHVRTLVESGLQLYSCHLG